MSNWEEWQRARRMRDGQESEKRRGNRDPERRRRADRGGDSSRGLNSHFPTCSTHIREPQPPGSSTIRKMRRAGGGSTGRRSELKVKGGGK